MLALLIALTIFGQTLRFEVSAIKPARPGERKIITFQGHHAILNGLPLKEVIKFAYGIHSTRIVGGPAWIDSDEYDIVAEPQMKTAPDEEQIMVMLQGLLADRFKLTLHHESKVSSAYALMVAAGGPKLRTSDGVGGKKTLTEFAAWLSRQGADRPVLDRSGLSGSFDFDFESTPAELGLKLEPIRTSVDVLVIDHVERPNEN